MTTETLIELFGYLGSVLVVVSMLMPSLVKLRIFNATGSVISATYALIIGSLPLALMNICLVMINVYNLYRLLKTERQYDLVDGMEHDTFLRYVLEHGKEDIVRYFPDFQSRVSEADAAYLVCCDGAPAGVLVGKRTEEGTLDVILDYSTPIYRDCSVGTYLYSKLPARGIKTLTFSQARSGEHTAYLTKMGFHEESGVLVKHLK